MKTLQVFHDHFLQITGSIQFRKVSNSIDTTYYPAVARTSFSVLIFKENTNLLNRPRKQESPRGKKSETCFPIHAAVKLLEVKSKTHSLSNSFQTHSEFLQSCGHIWKETKTQNERLVCIQELAYKIYAHIMLPSLNTHFVSYTTLGPHVPAKYLFLSTHLHSYYRKIE